MKSMRVASAVLCLAVVLALAPTHPTGLGLESVRAQGFDCTSVSEIPQEECQSLVALYQGTDGPHWGRNSGWLANNTPCSWWGVTCDAGYVRELDLYDNQLSGSIPPALGNLANLRHLNLFYNQLSGPIPLQLANLANLEWLLLGGTQLSGPIPAELGNLANLEVLNLGYNQLSGAIPPELGNLSNLQQLYLSGNQLSGSILPELGNLTNLQHLSLEGNQLSGPIPPELGNLANLLFLDLSGNQLSGPIPPWLGDLTNLYALCLYDNQLSGPIPPELGNLANLQTLDLRWNQLSGPIPPEVGDLTNLDSLSLGLNQLGGPIPPWLGDLANLQHLDLVGAQLSGPIPPELGDLTNLDALYLYDNQLSGPIPPELGNLANLQDLRLYDNQLDGPIPPELGNLVNLEVFYLECNQLSGPIPPELGNLSNLQHLYLYDNQLSGPIPPELGSLTNLHYLSLGDNQLSGPIPPELGNLANLHALYLYDNQLSGPIPPELGNLANLRVLYLRNNHLDGPLPHSLTALALDIFAFHDTNLCEPGDEAFQAWLAGIRDLSRTGVVCEDREATATPRPTTEPEPSPAPAPSTTPTPDQQMPWLLMYYLAGDNNLGEPGNVIDGDYITIANHARSNPNINVAIFHDTDYIPGSRYVSFKAGQAGQVFAKPELNTGAQQTLQDFMLWAMAEHPAARHALIIDDHGHGLGGAALDDTAGKDWLTPAELRGALAIAGGVDVLYMNACLMAQLEVEYELADGADYYVASQSISFGPRPHSYLHDMDKNTTPRQLAESMAHDYYSAITASKDPLPTTISVVALSDVERVRGKAYQLAASLRANWGDVKDTVWSLTDVSRVQRFDDEPDGIDNYDEIADLRCFALLVRDHVSLKEVQTAANELLSALDDYVLYNRATSGTYTSEGKKLDWNHDRAFGLSVALPRRPIPYYTGSWLLFAAGADWSSTPSISALPQPLQLVGEWGPFVVALVNEFNPEGPAVTEPPEPVPLAQAPMCAYLPFVRR